MDSNFDPDFAADLELLSRASVPASTLSEKNEAALAMRILKDHASIAAHAICTIVTESPNEKTRLAAAKYVLDRVIGPLSQQVDQGTNPWDELFGSVVREPTAAERAAGSRVSRS